LLRQLSRADELNSKDDFLAQLVKSVPTILGQQDKKTGRFGSGIWIVTDQNSMYPLAAAWSIKDARNPHYHSPKCSTR
jgi:hypothetical protein